MALSPGARLGHYDVTALLGEGGMGQVWQATDRKLNRQVALKVLPPDTAADPERLDRFQREAQVIAALNHPNVVTIYSVEEADATHFLTMELVEGKTLVEVIPPQGLTLKDLLALAIPLTDAVSAAHERGIVHRIRGCFDVIRWRRRDHPHARAGRADPASGRRPDLYRTG